MWFACGMNSRAGIPFQPAALDSDNQEMELRSVSGYFFTILAIHKYPA
jgi:hypothetical protein